MRLVLTALALAACGGDVGPSECDDICTELVAICDYAAYPSRDSCRQGCAWDASQGGDVTAALACFEAADCNTFEIVECQHAFGAE